MTRLSDVAWIWGGRTVPSRIALPSVVAEIKRTFDGNQPGIPIEITIDTIADQFPLGAPLNFTPVVHNPRNYPVSFSVLGELPPGVSISPSTGAISGSVGDSAAHVVRILGSYRIGSQIKSAFSNWFKIQNLVPEPDFLYAVGHGQSQTSITFDALSPITKQVASNVFGWLCRIRKSDGAVVWATKIAEDNSDDTLSSEFFWPSITSMSDGVVVVGSMSSNGRFNNHTFNFFDTSSDSVPAKTYNQNEDTGNERVYVVKYSKTGIIQWVQTIRIRSTNIHGFGNAAQLTAQSAAVRDNDNIVLGFSASITNASGGDQSKSDLRLNGPGFSDTVIFSGLGQLSDISASQQYQASFVVELDPNGALVQATKIVPSFPLSEPIVGSHASDDTMLAVSRHFDATGALALSTMPQTSGDPTIYIYGKGETHEFDSAALTTADFVGKSTVIKLDSALHVLWVADIIHGNTAKDVVVDSVDVDSAGNVYVAGSCKAPGGVTSTLIARSAGWAAPTITVTVPVDTAASGNRTIPFYARYNSAGVIQWLKIVSNANGALIPNNTLPFTLAVVNDVPYLVGSASVGANAGYTLDAGLGSQVTLVGAAGGDIAPFTRSFVVKLNPADGSVAWHKETRAVTDAANPTHSIAQGNTGGVDIAPVLIAPVGTQKLFVAATETAPTASVVWGPGEGAQTTLAPVQNGNGSVGLLDAATGALVWAKALPTSSNGGSAQNQVTAVTAEKTFKA